MSPEVKVAVAAPEHPRTETILLDHKKYDDNSCILFDRLDLNSHRELLIGLSKSEAELQRNLIQAATLNAYRIKAFPDPTREVGQNFNDRLIVINPHCYKEDDLEALLLLIDCCGYVGAQILLTHPTKFSSILSKSAFLKMPEDVAEGTFDRKMMRLLKRQAAFTEIRNYLPTIIENMPPQFETSDCLKWFKAHQPAFYITALELCSDSVSPLLTFYHLFEATFEGYSWREYYGEEARSKGYLIEPLTFVNTDDSNCADRLSGFILSNEWKKI